MDTSTKRKLKRAAKRNDRKNQIRLSNIPVGHLMPVPEAPDFGPPRFTPEEQAANPGKPMTRVVKDLARPGSWKSGFGADGRSTFENFDRPKLQRIVQNFHRMIASGHAVNVGKGHGDADLAIHADDLVAPMDDMKLGPDDVLWGSAYVTPEQADYLLNPARKVSLGLWRDYEAGDGEVYPGLCALHLAVTDRPVVTGQGSWLALTNSLAPNHSICLGVKGQVNNPEGHNQYTNQAKAATRTAIEHHSKTVGGGPKEDHSLHHALRSIGDGPMSKVQHEHFASQHRSMANAQEGKAGQAIARQNQRGTAMGDTITGHQIAAMSHREAAELHETAARNVVDPPPAPKTGWHGAVERMSQHASKNGIEITIGRNPKGETTHINVHKALVLQHPDGQRLAGQTGNVREAVKQLTAIAGHPVKASSQHSDWRIAKIEPVLDVPTALKGSDIPAGGVTRGGAGIAAAHRRKSAEHAVAAVKAKAPKARSKAKAPPNVDAPAPPWNRSAGTLFANVMVRAVEHAAIALGSWDEAKHKRNHGQFAAGGGGGGGQRSAAPKSAKKGPPNDEDEEDPKAKRPGRLTVGQAAAVGAGVSVAHSIHSHVKGAAERAGSKPMSKERGALPAAVKKNAGKRAAFKEIKRGVDSGMPHTVRADLARKIGESGAVLTREKRKNVARDLARRAGSPASRQLTKEVKHAVRPAAKAAAATGTVVSRGVKTAGGIVKKVARHAAGAGKAASHAPGGFQRKLRVGVKVLRGVAKVAKRLRMSNVNVMGEAILFANSLPNKEHVSLTR